MNTHEHEQLQKAVQDGHLALLIGADLAERWSRRPTRRDLAGMLAEHFGLDGASLAEVAQQVETRFGRAALLHRLQQIYVSAVTPPGSFQQRLAEYMAARHPRWFILTGFDRLLAHTFLQEKIGFNHLLTDNDLAVADPTRPSLVHLCGVITRPDTCVVTAQDHIRLANAPRHPGILAALSEVFRRYPVLCYGFDLSDPWFRTLGQRLGGHFPQPVYVVSIGVVSGAAPAAEWARTGVILTQNDPLHLLDMPRMTPSQPGPPPPPTTPPDVRPHLGPVPKGTRDPFDWTRPSPGTTGPHPSPVPGDESAERPQPTPRSHDQLPTPGPPLDDEPTPSGEDLPQTTPGDDPDPQKEVAAAVDEVKVEELRIDAAVPAQVEVNMPFRLAVAVRQKDAEPLVVEDLPVVHSSDPAVIFYTAPGPIRLRLRISAPGCTLDDADERSFRMLPGSNSATFFFHLTARRAGPISIIVQLFQDEDYQGAVPLTTLAVEMAAALTLSVPAPAPLLSAAPVFSSPIQPPPSAAVKAAVETKTKNLRQARLLLEYLEGELLIMPHGIDRARTELEKANTADLIKELEYDLDALLQPA